MKKYFIYTYLLLVRYRFYGHFFNLIFLKVKNIFTFYKLKKKEICEKQKSQEICNKGFLNNSDFFNNYENKDINLGLLEDSLKLYKKKFEQSYEKKGPANLELLYFCSELISAKHILETGVADGWSSLVFLFHISKEKIGKLTSIDLPYLNSLGEYKCGKVVDENFKPFWNLIVKPDTAGINILSNSSSKFDLIHYDSDKSIYGRQKNYPKLWKMLNNGGIFISDDIEDNSAFREFVVSNHLDFSVLKFEGKYVGVVRKNA